VLLSGHFGFLIKPKCFAHFHLKCHRLSTILYFLILGSKYTSSLTSFEFSDLFRGKINLDDTINNPQIRVDFRNGSENMMDAQVLVKVSSTAVHSLLIDPSETYVALTHVKTGKSEMVQEISSVLFALMGGYVEVAESVEDAAVRELQDEMNIRLERKDFALLGIYSDPRRDARRLATCNFCRLPG